MLQSVRLSEDLRRLDHSQLRGRRLPSDPNFQDVDLVVALWEVQKELDVVLALKPVSVQPVSLQRASPQFQYAEQVERVELWFPVSERLAPVSPQAANEELVVYLAQNVPVQRPCLPVASLRQAALRALLQRPGEEHTALLQGRLWQE